MKSVLVTGGLGFIGIHTSLILIDKGYRLIIIDSLENSSLDALSRLKKLASLKKNFKSKNIIFFKGDVRDIYFLRKVFKESSCKENKIDYVIHFAGLKSISQSIKKPELYFDVNVNGTIQLLNIMEEYNCRNLIFSSSATVYSKDEKSPLNELAKVSPENPYGDTKLKIEKTLENLCLNNQKNFKIICLRYFNPIGAHPSGLIGEVASKTANNLFPLICHTASKRREFLEIYGNDWPTFDGTCIRDYIHIMDLAEGHTAALECLDVNDYECYFNIFNLGTGKGTSVMELINIFQKVNNLTLKVLFGKRRDGDKAIVFADPSKAIKELKWIPKKSLEDMCQDGWRWELNNSK